MKRPATQKRRVYGYNLSEVAFDAKPLDHCDKVVEYWDACIASETDYEAYKERLVVIMLNSRLVPTKWHLVTLGSLNETVGHPREIFAPVLTERAYGFILLHNHPSGDPSPSQADKGFTQKIVQGAELLQLRFVDHIIIADKNLAVGERYMSFREAGFI